MPFDHLPPPYWGSQIPEHWHNAVFCWKLAEFELAGRTQSQCGQDILVDALANTYFNNQNCFYFLDFGANDGVSESSTQFLEKSGWKGILIEPNPFLFHKLTSHRTSKTILAALGRPTSIQPFVTSFTSDKLGTLKSNLTDYQNSRLHADIEAEPVFEFLVPVLTFELFLDFFYESFGLYPDFIKIDIEGGEESAIDMLCAHSHRPSIIELENNLRRSECANRLLENGYTCCCIFDSFVEVWVHERIRQHFDILTILRSIVSPIGSPKASHINPIIF